MKTELEKQIEADIDKNLTPLVDQLGKVLEKKPEEKQEEAKEEDPNPGIAQYLQEESGSIGLGGRKLDYSRHEPVKASGPLGGKDL